MSADLVVGVDVGSQGTCAQAIAADGTHAATSYVPHTLHYPQPGWAEQDAREWLGAVAQALAEVRRDGRQPAAARDLVRLAAGRDGGGRRRRRAGRAGPDLDGPARRGRVRRGRAPDRPGPPARAHRLQPRSRPRGRQDRLAATPTGPTSTRRRAGSCCRARLSPGGRRARSRSTRPMPRRRCCSTSPPADGRRRRAPRSGSTRRRSRRCGRPTRCSARSPRGCATRRGSTPRRWSCSAAATRWRRRSAPVWSTRGRCAT